MQRFIIHPLTRFLCLALVLLSLGYLALGNTGLKERISNIVFENYMKAKPRESSGLLVFVDIDDESLTQIGQWPWPRKTIAELITNIDKAGAAVIIFDGVLAEPDRTSPENIAALLEDGHPAQEALSTLPANDVVLADAIRSTGKFVAGFSYGSNAQPPLLKKRVLAKRDVKSFILSQQDYNAGYFQTTAQFLRPLQKAAAGNGSFMASAEADSVIRRTGLIFHNGQQIFPSLILEGLRLYERDGKELIKLSANEDYTNTTIQEPLMANIGRYQIPMSVDGKMWVYFRKFTQDESIPANQFIANQTLPDLKGKIVFIASSAEGLMDLRATPLGMQPGVRVHMNALEQILQHNYLIRPHTAALLEVGAAIIVSAIIIILSFFINPLWLALIVISTSASAFGVSWYLFDMKGGLINPVTPTIIVSFVFVAASILSYLKTELDRRQVRDAFGLYISPDFMKELTSSPEKLELGGEIRDLSIMFTDIRSFTSISEGLAPDELIQLMNDFLTPMSDLVMQNRGTIDKYMGDAMMAFWNAPLDDAEHARNACRAALGMQAALAPINEQIAKKAEESGKEPVLLQAGIGINTGPCAVGNMGSKQRFAYSTLGDAVNLASRLEGQTKNYGVDILIGEETHRCVTDFACLEMDLIKVKGKQEAVRIFALIGDEDVKSDSDFSRLKEKHEKMIACYQAGDFKEAKKLAKECKGLRLYNLDMFYELYIKRCDNMIKNPLDHWDGVFVATTK